MGYILPSVYQVLLEQGETNQELPKIFVETGTFKGGISHKVMENRIKQKLDPILDSTFDEYYTIELGKSICQIASMRYGLMEIHGHNTTQDMIHSDSRDYSFKDVETYFDDRLTLINGDSPVELSRILRTLDQPCCFWLDAHAGAAKYAKGSEDVPLFRELEAIKNHHVKNHVVGIDDAHLFGKVQTDSSGLITCDYSDITFEKVKAKIKEINPNYDIGIYNPFGMPMVLAYVKE
jgi:hypothetical protein